MKNKIILILACILFLCFLSILPTISQFASSHTTDNNYIQIGKFKPRGLSLDLYALTGPKLKYRINIPSPDNDNYIYVETLKSSPYTQWAYTKSNQIVNMITLGTAAPNNEPFPTTNDENYFKKNHISFDSNSLTGFSSENGFHLFAIIHNNAHLVDNPKKISLSANKLNFEASVSLKGETTGRTWDTYYKKNIDFRHSKYYVTHTYTYNSSKKTYEASRDRAWSFYRNFDLVIVDLGITGSIEMNHKNWSKTNPFSPATHYIYQQMLVPFNSQIDSNAQVFKAHYNITFIPSGESKEIKQSLFLGN